MSTSKGSVRQRHTARCPRDPEGKGYAPHKCRGTWWWVLNLSPDPMTGKRRQPSKSGFRTKSEAESDLAKARERLGVTGGRSEGLPTGDWLDQWLASLHSKSPTTYARYEGIVRLHLKPLIGNVPLVQLAPDHIDALLATVGEPEYVAEGLDDRHRKRAKQQSSASVNRIFACLRRALSVAAKRRLITWNPALAVDPPTEVNAEGVAWTPQEAAFFLDGLDDDRLAPAWHVALVSGARRAELCGARWDLLDLEAAIWFIKTTTVQVGGKVHHKDAKSQAGMRAVYLDAETVTVLRGHRKRQLAERLAATGTWTDTGLVFVNADGTAIKPDKLSRAWKQTCAAAVARQAREAAAAGVRLTADEKFPAIKLHETRHTSNTIARLYAKVDQTVLRERMGHTEDVTNGRYTHGHPALHRQAADDIAAQLQQHRRRRPAGGQQGAAGL